MHYSNYNVSRAEPHGNKMLDKLVKLLTDSLVDCDNANGTIPHAKEYLLALTVPSIMAITLACITCVATICLAVLHFMYIISYVTHPSRRLFIVYLASTAPFVSILSLVAMFMPRVWFFAHLASFQYFSLALWVIILLLVQLFSGHHNFVRKLAESTTYIALSTPPFCCFFPCMPKMPLESRYIRACEWMVLQAPCVRLIATLVSLIIYFEYAGEGMVALKVIDFLALPSLLIGIYGTHIIVTTVSKVDELIPYRYIVVFRLLDFFFMFFGVQHPIFDFVARWGLFDCGSGLLPALETAFFWKNLCVVLESFMVTMLSTYLLQPSRSAFFDKHPSCRSVSSSSTKTIQSESSA